MPSGPRSKPKLSLDGKADRRLYGRRQGRPLRSIPKRLMADLLPQIAVPKEGPLNPTQLFGPACRQVWLEIGFGGGEHLVEQALAHPDCGLIGAEVFLNGVASALRLIEEGEVSNVRLHHGDARELLERLPDGCLTRIFLLFPDPWPKLRHAKRRFVSDWSLGQFHRLLAPGGELRLASDDPVYQAWMRRHLTGHPGFEPIAEGSAPWAKRPADWPVTRYEKKALAAGRKPLFLRFGRRALAAD